jgi:hypothetical protein
MDAELGRLLQALAAARWRVAEIGAGEASALMAEAVPPGGIVVTAGPGEWHETLMANAPFDLVFLGDAAVDGASVLELVAPGGIVVAPSAPFWLEHPDLYAVELRELGVVLAARQARAFATS